VLVKSDTGQVDAGSKLYRHVSNYLSVNNASYTYHINTAPRTSNLTKWKSLPRVIFGVLNTLTKKSFCLLWCDAVWSDICVPTLRSNLLAAYLQTTLHRIPQGSNPCVLHLQRTWDSLLCIDDGMIEYNTRGIQGPENKFAIVTTLSIYCRSSDNILFKMFSHQRTRNVRLDSLSLPRTVESLLPNDNLCEYGT
jgi:hypothetical protein